MTLKFQDNEKSVRELENSMTRTLVLYLELNRYLDIEYQAGKDFKSKALEKNTLKKKTCLQQLEKSLRTIQTQLVQITDKDAKTVSPSSLADVILGIKMLDNQKTCLGPLALALDAQDRAVKKKARRNMLQLRAVVIRLSAFSSYSRHACTVRDHKTGPGYFQRSRV